MISIRLQRTGRRKHAQFRMVVQDSRRAPTSGRVIANLGHYNPHTKEHNLDFQKASYYLQKGAQPSERVIFILQSHKVDLPNWVKTPLQSTKGIKNPDKLRKNQPKEEVSNEVDLATEEVIDKAEAAEENADDNKESSNDSEDQAHSEAVQAQVDGADSQDESVSEVDSDESEVASTDEEAKSEA